MVNRYYRDMPLQIAFYSYFSNSCCVEVNCVKTSGNSSFPFAELVVKAESRNSQGFVLFKRREDYDCNECPGGHISQFNAEFSASKQTLVNDGSITSGNLTLKLEFK